MPTTHYWKRFFRKIQVLTSTISAPRVQKLPLRLEIKRWKFESFKWKALVSYALEAIEITFFSEENGEMLSAYAKQLPFPSMYV